MNPTIHDEVSLVDLSDAELKEFLGHAYHAIRNLEEERRTDPELARLWEVYKSYRSDNFDDDIKDFKAKMKAARAIAKVKGIRWTPPEKK